MFEQELETLHHIVRSNTIGNGPSISIKSILESNIPTSVKSFFKSDIEWLLFQERRQETRSRKFNYDQEDIRMLQEQTDFLLVYHYVFTQEEFLTVCDKAVHFLFNYLCRPVWTLENFLFDEKNSLTLDELKIKFNYCSDYSYYRTITERYLHTKNKTEISREETVDLLRKIDREIIRENSAVEVARMTEPFFTFIRSIQNTIGANAQRGIPPKALSYFFDDKQLPSVSDHILKLRDRGITSIQYDELVSELKDVFMKKGSYLEKESIAVPRRDANVAPPETLVIPERDRLSIVAGLFRNDESAYTVLLNGILQYQTWDEASLALDHYFTMNDIEPFSRDAILFINALQSAFTGKRSE
ncbi:MAG: hypothetical protein ACYC09_02415 [Bacteroidota bacterium]